MTEHREPASDARLSASQVQSIASLARLRITEKDANDYSLQLARVMKHFQSLQSTDLEGVEPLAHPTSQTLRLQADQPTPPLDRESLMSLAPESVPPFIKVPKVFPGASRSQDE